LTHRVYLFLTIVSILILAASCQSRRGLSGRYRAEKEFFVADKMATRILNERGLGRVSNTQEIVRLFDSLISRFSLETLEDRSQYSEREARAIKDIVWKASLRAAGLVSLSGDTEETVRRYKAISERFGSDEQLAPMALYLGARAREASGEWNESLEAYEKIIDGFLSGDWGIGSFEERMMEIPYLMARLIEPSHDERTLGSVMERGRVFFEWVAESDSTLAVYSRLGEARTYALEKRWRHHVSSLRDLLGSSLPGLDAVRPLVFLDVALAYKDGLAMQDSALSYCSLVVRDYSSHTAAAEALFIEASILRERGELEKARRLFQTLAARRSGVSAPAMLELGALYETLGRWEDARAEYGSLRGFFPHSVHNYEALLRVIRHYKATGDRDAMIRAADEAAEFLRGEIKDLPATQAALVARGFLVDALLLVGRTEEAAQELEAIAGLYGTRASGILALLKAARIHQESGAQEKARQLLREFEERYGGSPFGQIAGSEFF